MSRDARSVYHYSTLMLGDLGPRQPTVRGWPCYLWPPPQLIVGYPYFVRVCHDYALTDAPSACSDSENAAHGSPAR